jgi:hypothetical protein
MSPWDWILQMKNKHEEAKKLNDLTPSNQERLALIEGQIKAIKARKHITEETIKELDNLISELLILRSGFVDNIINWTKQGYLTE